MRNVNSGENLQLLEIRQPLGVALHTYIRM